MDDLTDMPDELPVLLPRFAEMVASTPALRAAWLELNDRLVQVATEELAARPSCSTRGCGPSACSPAERARQQLREAATAAEEAREQVFVALRKARAAWREAASRGARA
jgi:hypothetical protein